MGFSLAGIINAFGFGADDRASAPAPARYDDKDFANALKQAEDDVRAARKAAERLKF